MVKIKTDQVKLADLRYYDASHGGIELTNSYSKGILIDFNGREHYENLFCLGESYPVFKRAPFANCTSDGDEYGTKVFHVSNELVTGPCWILSNIDLGQILEKDEVSISELEDYVLASNHFFKDRASIAFTRAKEAGKSLRMQKIISDDQLMQNMMDEFFSQRMGEKWQKIKK